MKNTSRFLLTALCALTAAFPALAGPIGKGGFTIAKPGKYTLIRNLAAKPKAGGFIPIGISIEADDVELDLAGFTIGPAPGAEGIGAGIILHPAAKRVRIHNGSIQGVQLGIGVGSNAAITSCIFEQIHISNCSTHGISIAGSANIIRSCTVTHVGGGHSGIVVLADSLDVNEVSDCSILDGGGASTGINSGGTHGLLVRRCVVQGLEEGYRVTPFCKLYDNSTIYCSTPFFGSPQLIGVNN